MERTLVKKNIHLTKKEELHVAKLIVSGGTQQEISDWHSMRFGKPMARSKFFRFKSKAKEIIANADETSMKKAYTRVGEEDLRSFEEHLKVEIASRSNSVPKWTYLLLTVLANEERKKEPFANMEALKKYTFTSTYWLKYMFRQKLRFSSRKSDQKNFRPDQITKFRASLSTKIMFYDKFQVLNFDETGFFYNEIRGRIVTEKGISYSIYLFIYFCLGVEIRYKLDKQKERVSFCPVIRCGSTLPGYKPMFISRTKGVKWGPSRLETKKVKKSDGTEIELERRIFETFILYNNSNAWMTSHFFDWEMERLARYLKKEFPHQKFILILDNAPSHTKNKYENLDFVFLEPGTTGIMQPLDRCPFAVVKSQYRSWLAKEKLLSGAPITQKMAVVKITELFSNISMEALNYAWRSTGVDKFQSLGTETPDVSPEMIINELNEKLEEELVISN